MKRLGANSTSAGFSCAWFVTKCPPRLWWELDFGSSPGTLLAFQPYLSDSICSATSSELLRDCYTARALGLSLNPEEPGRNVFCTLKFLLTVWDTSFCICSSFLPSCFSEADCCLGLLQVHVVLKLWKSGFSLDSGELRSYQDPSNAQFLDDIRRGYVGRREGKNSCFLQQKCLCNPGC